MEGIVPIPIPLEAATPVSAGQYTDIIGIDAPSSAGADSVVSITVRIKNIYSSPIGIMVVAYHSEQPMGEYINFPDKIKNVTAGATESFLGSFKMPGKEIIIYIYSYYYTSQGWYLDDEDTRKITVRVEQPVFSNLSVAFARG